jgi:hypothetical protein
MLTAMASVCRKVAAWSREFHGVSFTAWVSGVSFIKTRLLLC